MDKEQEKKKKYVTKVFLAAFNRFIIVVGRN